LELPNWVGKEITGDPRYRKINMLAQRIADFRKKCTLNKRLLIDRPDFQFISTIRSAQRTHRATRYRLMRHDYSLAQSDSRRRVDYIRSL
jgi:hypothetical protein